MNPLLNDFDYSKYIFRPVLGFSGSGKGQFLELSEKAGDQVITVETLVGVKGICLANAFETPLISHDEFLHKLYEKILSFDQSKEILFEWKGDRLTVFDFPFNLKLCIRSSRPINLFRSFDERIQRLMIDYVEWSDHLDLLLFHLLKVPNIPAKTLRKLDVMATHNMVELFVSCLVREYFDPIYLTEYLKFDSLSSNDHKRFLDLDIN
jgi:hypothetical protein